MIVGLQGSNQRSIAAVGTTLPPRTTARPYRIATVERRRGDEDRGFRGYPGWLLPILCQ